MKKLLTAIFLLPTMAFAYNYDAGESKCAELKDALEREGKIYITYRSIFRGGGMHYVDKSQCENGSSYARCYRARPAAVSTVDGVCGVGYKCQKINTDDCR